MCDKNEQKGVDEQSRKKREITHTNPSKNVSVCMCCAWQQVKSGKNVCDVSLPVSKRNKHIQTKMKWG